MAEASIYARAGDGERQGGVRRGRILHGGASPEEVLMPAYSWLTGDLH